MIVALSALWLSVLPARTRPPRRHSCGAVSCTWTRGGSEGRNSAILVRCFRAPSSKARIVQHLLVLICVRPRLIWPRNQDRSAMGYISALTSLFHRRVWQNVQMDFVEEPRQKIQQKKNTTKFQIWPANWFSCNSLFTFILILFTVMTTSISPCALEKF